MHQASSTTMWACHTRWRFALPPATRPSILTHRSGRSPSSRAAPAFAVRRKGSLASWWRACRRKKTPSTPVTRRAPRFVPSTARGWALRPARRSELTSCRVARCPGSGRSNEHAEWRT
eukprot:2371108-Prymnesium_polylepis.4